MRRLLRPLRRVGWLVVLLLALWFGGFFYFVAASLLASTDASAATDAIVVLTGGRLRLETGVALLVAGKAKKLFISGVNQRVDRDELLHSLGPAAERESCCIAVGYDADNTLGNARETAAWMRQQGYRSLRLVTSWYHMQRSLAEFEHAMPQMAIVANPVFAQHLDPERWWNAHGAALLIVGEYHKYLAARLRPLLDAVVPTRGHPATTATAGRQ